MPVRHFYLLPHYICDGLFFYFLCFGFTRNVFNNLWEKEGRGRRSWLILSFWYQNTEKRNNALSQMRLRSVFKMRMSILNTATTEQMGYDIISFFVCFPLNKSKSYPCIFSIRRAVSSVSFFRELTIAVF